jgi:hypothetical protein
MQANMSITIFVRFIWLHVRRVREVCEIRGQGLGLGVLEFPANRSPRTFGLGSWSGLGLGIFPGCGLGYAKIWICFSL